MKSEDLGPNESTFVQEPPHCIALLSVSSPVHPEEFKEPCPEYLQGIKTHQVFKEHI